MRPDRLFHQNGLRNGVFAADLTWGCQLSTALKGEYVQLNVEPGDEPVGVEVGSHVARLKRLHEQVEIRTRPKPVPVTGFSVAPGEFMCCFLCRDD